MKVDWQLGKESTNKTLPIFKPKIRPSSGKTRVLMYSIIHSVALVEGKSKPQKKVTQTEMIIFDTREQSKDYVS